MANPLSGPGLILTFFKEKPSSTVSADTLENWFADEFAPALLSTGAVESASLYKAANPSYDKQNLLVYKIKDLAIIASGALSALPRTSKTGLFDGEVDEHAVLDRRVYVESQIYEPKAQKKGPEQTIMLAMMQPAPTPEAQADLDEWYRDEHNAQMSKEPGYLRTSRYRLLNQTSSGGSETQELSFLAVHGFDEGNVLGTEVKPLDPMTEWTKKVMGQAVGIDAGIYGLVRVFGA